VTVTKKVRDFLVAGFNHPLPPDLSPLAFEPDSARKALAVKAKRQMVSCNEVIAKSINPQYCMTAMAPRTFAVDAFKDLPGVAEIIALGRVQRQPEAALEAQIEVLLASNLDDPEFNPERDVQIRWVACGQIDLLTVGSRWKDGRPSSETQARRYSAHYSVDDNENLGVGADAPVGYRRRLPTRLMADAPCFLLERHLDNDQSDGPIWVALPQVELVRALFGVSSRLLIELIDGLRDPAVADRGILDRQNSWSLPDGTVHLACWRKPTDEEALILAVMVADPTIMRLHDEVFQQLVVQKGYRDDKPSWPKVTWPFPQPTGLTLEGRWFERVSGRSRFLATRITKIGLRIGFSRIQVHYPGGGEEEAPDRLPPPSGRMRPLNARVLVLTTGRAPSPSRRPVDVASAPVAIPESAGVAIEFVAKGGPPRPPTSTLGEDPREQGEFSTASRESGADTAVGPALIRRTGGDTSAAASAREKVLRFTWAALCAAAEGSGWRLTPYPAAGVGDLSLRDGGFDFRREGVLAGLSIRGRHVIVADERVAPEDFRSFGVLVKTMERSVTWRDIGTIRAAHDALQGHWGSGAANVDGFAIATIRRHREILVDADAYTKLLCRGISRAIAKAG
jgi:hypothetical protein